MSLRGACPVPTFRYPAPLYVVRGLRRAALQQQPADNEERPSTKKNAPHPRDATHITASTSIFTHEQPRKVDQGVEGAVAAQAPVRRRLPHPRNRPLRTEYPVEHYRRYRQRSIPRQRRRLHLLPNSRKTTKGRPRRSDGAGKWYAQAIRFLSGDKAGQSAVPTNARTTEPGMQYREQLHDVKRFLYDCYSTPV